ncbi:unnamed protein product [Rhodiola kirilowii]
MGQFVGPHALFLKLFISVSLSFSRLFCFLHFSSLAGRKKKAYSFLGEIRLPPPLLLRRQPRQPPDTADPDPLQSR